MIYNGGPEKIRGAIWLTALLITFGYTLVNAFVPNQDMNIAICVLTAAAATMVIYVYGRDAWIAIRNPEPKRTDYLIVGVVLAWISTDLLNILAILFRASGMPAWFVNSELYGPARLIAVIAAVLHVSAPGGSDGPVPPRNRIAMGVGLAAAVLLGLTLLWARPDIGWYLDRARPYISDFFETGAIVSDGPHPS